MRVMGHGGGTLVVGARSAQRRRLMRVMGTGEEVTLTHGGGVRRDGCCRSGKVVMRTGEGRTERGVVVTAAPTTTTSISSHTAHLIAADH